MTSSRFFRLGLLVSCALLVPACTCEDPGEEPVPEPATPAPNWDRGYYMDMAQDSQGRLWLAYQDRNDGGELASPNQALFAARGSGSPLQFEHWHVEGLGEVVGGLLTGSYTAGNFATIAVDSSDVPHMAHWDAEGNRLMYAVRAGDGWDTGMADSGGGEYASIGILDGTDPIVAYYKGGSLSVAVRSGGTWSTETVDEGTSPEAGEDEDPIPADVGQYADLLVDSSGTVHIAYYDLANGDLKLASGAPGSWDIRTAWSEGNVGTWPNLSESAGDLWIAFQDLGNHDLLFGRWTGSELEVELVDSSDFAGADSSTAWLDGSPAIMYHDGVNNDAVLAIKDGSEWTLSTHMADGAVGFNNSLIASDSGELSWSCFNHTSTDIVFSRFGL